jgi:endogenous inhibitor of DNA gyrase (YacG/DUF329 family)
MVTKSKNKVTFSKLNTHCIVCKTPFNRARSSKLYCSARCKQFGYNHKDELRNIRDNASINEKHKCVKLSQVDYEAYLINFQRVKRYRELLKRNQKFIEEMKKSDIRQEMGIIYNSENDVYMKSQELDNQEVTEMSKLKKELKELASLEATYLTIEQWSFLKLLHKSLDNRVLFKLISNFSKEYIKELSLSVTNEDIDQKSNIKQKFIAHCNNLTDGATRII